MYLHNNTNTNNNIIYLKKDFVESSQKVLRVGDGATN